MPQSSIDQFPFWFLFPLQTLIVYWLGCLIYGDKLKLDADSIIHVWIPTTGVILIALLMGVPFWRDTPFGDAYDFGMATFFLTAFSGKLSLMLRHRAVRHAQDPLKK